MRKTQRQYVGIVAFLIALVATSAPLLAAEDGKSASDQPGSPAVLPSPLLDAGFHQLYELNFQGARANFLSFQQQHPEDPLGKAAEAASYLYEQFNTKGIFSSSFFLNDSKFLNGADGTAAQNRNEAFLTANGRAREMAKEQLKSNPNDAHALLVLTMTDGMEADYDALIVKKQLAGLGLTKQAEGEATKLLAVDPTAEDAYLALGAANYVIGCLPGYKRAFLWFGGIHGDRARGMDQMQRTADHGHYLQPFAKILLALASEREHQEDRARALLTALSNEFPANPLYAHELALIDHSSVPCRLTTTSC
ncbi:MAG TPA: hypothetical protein VEJ46_14485 [Candidatus Acidoferrum sp.]|nr:hypothetical protein [Candidatus Acidoferrum sp.]